MSRVSIDTPQNGYFLAHCFNHTLGIEIGDQTVSFVSNAFIENEPIFFGKNSDKKRLGGGNDGRGTTIKNENDIILDVTTVFGDWFFGRDSNNSIKYPNGYFINDPVQCGFSLFCNPTCNLPLNDTKYL